MTRGPSIPHFGQTGSSPRQTFGQERRCPFPTALLFPLKAGSPWCRSSHRPGPAKHISSSRADETILEEFGRENTHEGHVVAGTGLPAAPEFLNELGDGVRVENPIPLDV